MRDARSVARACLVLLAVAGCSTRVANTTPPLSPAEQAPGVLPRPARIVVVDFTADASTLRLDQGIGPRLQRGIQGNDEAADRQRMLTEVQNAIAETLVDNVRRMGLVAERAALAPSIDANTVVVQGQITRIDQGNRSRRLAIGFGAGKSDVSASVQLSYDRPGAPSQVVQTYDADSDSGRKPGLALGAASAAGGGSLAPAALTGATGAVSERNKSPVEKEGGKLAEHLAADLGGYFAQQGWIPASAVPNPSLR